jgi:hypothetical protein
MKKIRQKRTKYVKIEQEIKTVERRRLIEVDQMDDRMKGYVPVSSARAKE